ncbi:hypothetical protein DVH24_014348 [Malus domestica]|uniref:CRAL-TRIO domain-containing protein n=1 Tax=Malus domestica TaxID=3750 RepID=A0A498IUB0_MALDO|nr:hypothetical protein DVH24_014348 [Malus domestica]
MGIVSQEAIKQFQALMDQVFFYWVEFGEMAVDEPLKRTFQNVHQGYLVETFGRFLKARDSNVAKAHKMKPIVPTELYRGVRDSQLIGLSGYSREGLPIFAIGVGLSTFDKASVHYYVQSHIQINEYRDRPSASKKYGKHITTCIKVLDMTGLKLSALSQIKLMTIISTIDDLNYPERTNTYYIVVKPLLQERTRKKVQVLSGCGRDELLKIMDYASLPHFCKSEGSGSSRNSQNGADNCFSLDHHFHQQLYNHIKQQSMMKESVQPFRHGSFHVDVPEAAAERTQIAKTIESEFNKFGNGNGLSESIDGLKINVSGSGAISVVTTRLAIG